MSHYIRIQNAVDFIEKNLNKPFTLTDVSKTAFSSLSYFHRIFYFMTGFTVKEYIRKRRLSQAAYQLRCTDLSITEIAFNTCYETPESFTRAFKKHYGVSPRTFRQKKQEQILFDKLDILKTYVIHKKSDLDFELKLEYVLYKETQMLGFQTHTTMEGGQQAIDICNFANKIIANNKLAQYFNLRTTPIFGIYTNMSDENEFDYTIGCLASACTSSAFDLVSHIIPNSQYARFTLNRLDRIKEAWHYIYGSWFPKYDANRTHGFDLEIYHPTTVDIYIPMATPP